MRAGGDLFFAAVVSVLTNLPMALRILALPLLLRYALDLAIEGSADPENTFLSLVILPADMAMVAFIAVGWHRFVLLNEVPGLFNITPGLGRLALYAVRWMVLGLVVGVVVLLVAAVTLFAARFCCLPPDFGLMSFLMSDHAPPLTNPYSTLTITAFVWLYTWLFFRLAMALPHWAISDDPDNLPGSWQATWAQRRAILWCAALAAVASMVLVAPTFWMYDLFPDSFIFAQPMPGPDRLDPYRYSPAYLAVVNVTWGGMALFGAAMLTEIYSRARVAQSG